jgi:hypothetical protein
MTAKPKPNPKRDSSGKFLPKWAGELQENVDHLGKMVGANQEWTRQQLVELRERLGTSTPLIIWNIAVLIAIAYLYAKAYAQGSVP